MCRGRAGTRSRPPAPRTTTPRGLRAKRAQPSSVELSRAQPSPAEPSAVVWGLGQALPAGLGLRLPVTSRSRRAPGLPPAPPWGRRPAGCPLQALASRSLPATPPGGLTGAWRPVGKTFPCTRASQALRSKVTAGRLQKSKESRAWHSSSCPHRPCPRTALGLLLSQRAGKYLKSLLAQPAKHPPSQTPYARDGWRKWALPNLPRRNLGQRGTGLALRAPSSWCQSQDLTPDFHPVS